MTDNFIQESMIACN